jgi:hypothetical protein
MSGLFIAKLLWAGGTMVEVIGYPWLSKLLGTVEAAGSIVTTVGNPLSSHEAMVSRDEVAPNADNDADDNAGVGDGDCKYVSIEGRFELEQRVY